MIWRTKIQEGKDRPKNDDGGWAFPSDFETQALKNIKTAVLMLEMTRLIHGSGRVVTVCRFYVLIPYAYVQCPPKILGGRGLSYIVTGNLLFRVFLTALVLIVPKQLF